MEAREKSLGSDSDIDPEALKQLYCQVLKKKNNKCSKTPESKPRSRSRSRDVNRRGSQRVKQQQRQDQISKQPQLFKYAQHSISLQEIPGYLQHLPVFKKKSQIIETILNNQITIVTGETGCGKSTQVPRLLYQYLKVSKSPGKILCVQPRRLAAINLQKLLTNQIRQKGVVSYQIAMAHNITSLTKILFMTNGIFLQRFIHNSSELLEEYPFIILDEVHERDIDTDFILLAMKHLVRKHPKMRVVLMSATIDNCLFRYYFAEDHISKFLQEQNLYMKCLQIADSKPKPKKEKWKGDRSDSQESQDIRIRQEAAMEFMNSSKPCPSIQITEQGSYKKKIFYLDTLAQFTSRQIVIEWANTSFDERYPTLSKQIQRVGVEITEQIFRREEEGSRFTILVFLPGLAQIHQFCAQLSQSFTVKYPYDLIQLHSSTLTPQISAQLNETKPVRPRLIVATNIAESSITVMGVKYIIDFCMSKEVKFNHKSRLQNLEMIWSSQASSQQRAGRTGRVCDGYVIRLLEKEFYDKLPKYSTPQIQRCSLDRLVLRIKLLHQNQISQKSPAPLFADPGMVLGRAIQPPSLKHIDASIKSLLFNGGLEMVDQQFVLTDLGKLYIDLPVDIVYARMLIVSLMFGTFDDIIILVTLLQQAKNPFKKQGIQKKYMDYWQLIQNEQYCDFYGMVKIYKKKFSEGQRISSGIQAFSQNQLRIYKTDIQRRLYKFDLFKRRPVYTQDHELRFKLTIWVSFLDNAMKAVIPSRDQKQEKRVRQVEARKLPVDRTLVINSTTLKKTKTVQNNDEFINHWKQTIASSFRIKGDPEEIYLNYVNSYIVFNKPLSAYKILFCKTYEQMHGVKEEVLKNEDQGGTYNQKGLNFSVGGTKRVGQLTRTLNALGDVEFMNQAEAVDVYTNRRMRIDNLSVNRVISMKDCNDNLYLVTNTKHERSAGSYCRYTCLLPNKLGLYQTILLCFYPYISVKTDAKRTCYQFIRLRQKCKIGLKFSLSNQDIKQINVIRQMAAKYLKLELGSNQQKPKELWYYLRSMMETKREVRIDERKWQKMFLSHIKYQQSEQTFEDTKQQLRQMKYMSPIQTLQLQQSYFSYQHLSPKVFHQHITKYNDWKLTLLATLDQMRSFMSNTDTHVSCRQCHVKIANLRDVYPVSSFMRTFRPLPGALVEAVFDENNDEFCGMLLSFDLHNFKVMSCVNGHIMALKVGSPEQCKFLEFSKIDIMFCNQQTEEADFDRMEMRNYEKKAARALREKNEAGRPMICQICDEKFGSVPEMEKHIKTWMHQEILKEFKASLMTN